MTVEMFLPLKQVAMSDDVSHGLDYADVTDEVQILANTERKTIERFAEDIAATILKNFKPKGGVKVTVTKKPMLPLESASVTIVRP